MSLRAALLHRAADWIPSAETRARVYRASGVRLGKDVFVGEGVLFDKLYPHNIVVGDRVAIGARCIITGHQTTVTALALARLYPDKEFVTRIEHDCWLMPGVTITPGVTIGHHSVIATGVVVHKDVPPYSVVVGPGFRIAKTMDPRDLGEGSTA